MKKVLVIGLGCSGMGAIEFLLSQKREVVATDKNEKLLKSIPKKEGLILQKEVDLKEIDLVILSPGVPANIELVKRAKERGIEVIGEIELALRNCKNKILAITGSNGKTTVTLMTEFVLNRAGIKAKSVGNVGDSLASYLLKAKDEILVLELSSYQLETMKTQALDAGVILNISPDHLDRYSSMQEYVRAKLNIFNCLKKDSFLFVSKEVKETYFREEKRVVELKLDGVKSQGEMENLAASLNLCKLMGVGEKEFFEIVKEFKKPSHRVEFVKEIKGINFYDDSKATNVESVIHAITLIEKKLILIAGGVDKKLSFVSWNDKFKKRVKKVFAIGESAVQIKNELKDIDVEIVTSLKDAVKGAYLLAKEGDAVLLSPGCASFDMFRNYKHRGEEFKRCVLNLEKGAKK